MVGKNTDLQKAMRTFYIIWGMLFSSIPIYLFVAWFFTSNNMVVPFLDESTLSSIRVVLYALAPVTLLLAVFLKKRMLAEKDIYEQKPQVREQVDIAVALARYSGTMIMVWACADAVSIYGFVLFLLGGNAIDLHVLALLSAASFYVFRPKLKEVLYLVKITNK